LLDSSSESSEKGLRERLPRSSPGSDKREENDMANARKQEMVTAAFRDRANATEAHEWLLANGYTPNEINLLM
jgi:hypothetical protein